EGCLEFFKGYRFDSPTFGISGNNFRSHRFPDIGSVATELLGTDCRELPGYVFCPGANLPNLVGNTGFLPSGRAPWKLGTKSLGENLADPEWRVRSLDPQPGIDRDRLLARRELLNRLDHSTASRERDVQLINTHHGHAFDLLTSPSVQNALTLQ